MSAPEEPPRRPPAAASQRRPPAVEDDAPVELRHRALLELLVAKGVITVEEYRRELRRLVGPAR
jgi:hypothetical protein